METAQVRLPRPRSTTTVNHRNNNTIPTANTTTVSHTIQANTLPNNYHHYNNNNNYHHYSTSNSNGGLNAQRHYTFPQITPPSAVHAQRSRHARPNETGLVTPVKPVYKLKCRHCSTIVCARGMKAILLADLAIELYSTDTPSQCIYVLEKDYLTRSCLCRIRDVACLECGNVIGYHVVSPCASCLDSSNNGHFWMFHSSACQPAERKDGKHVMLWNNLPRADKDFEFMMGTRVPYDQLCR